MLPFDDPRWKEYRGGYRVPYDASPALRKLLNPGASPEVWDELWEELHHQDAVDNASYAAVPWLVEFIRRSTRLDWNPLALIAVIEFSRPTSAAMAPELAEAYFASIKSLPLVLGAHPDQEWDEQVARTAMACIALARAPRWYARACFELERATAERWFREEFGWDFDDV